MTGYLANKVNKPMKIK